MADVKPKIMAGVRRRPGMTHAEYLDYIVTVHGELSKAQPGGLKRYVQNHVYDAAFGSVEHSRHEGIFHRDSVTELYFDNFQEMGETFSSEYVRTVIAPDGAKFAEEAVTDTILMHETVLTPPAHTGGTKIMHFLHAGEKGAKAAQDAWADVHAKALSTAADFAAAITGLARSDALQPLQGDAVSHFGKSEVPLASLVVSIWVPDDAIGLFRDYEAAILKSSAFDARHSYFLFTRECEIMDLR